ncbi:MAG: diaminopimelate epimerase [Chloroflexota bacterium]|nr:diaminopimelate epimerase [Chloroflexota bacterium]MDE2883723.1 diaminopimelate epimerase [Chloroflexota bacterium]
MHFTKLQGAGNDYIYVDGLNEQRDWPDIARRIADRHFGVGADGLIVVAPSERAPVRMRMYNLDGSEGEMCGNGIRCFAKFVLERGMVPVNGSTLDVETGAGVLTIAPHWRDDRVVGARVDMGEPILRAADVPVDVSKMGPSDYAALDAGLVESLGLRPEELAFDAPVEVNGVTFTLTAVSMGNPHVSAFIDEPVNDVELDRIGPRMEHHEAYPRRINFHLVNYVGRDHLVSRTWERGSGLTLACGTGASAMVVAARLHGLVDDVVRVDVPGGELTITWPGHGSVFMDGDAVEVFSGDFPD